MAEFGVIRSFTLPDGRKIVSVRPDVMRKAIEAAAAVGRDTAKTYLQTSAPKATVGATRDGER
jgi:hypothetical protein